MKRTLPALFLAFTLCVCTAVAADATTLLPTEVRESQNGDFRRIEKVYLLDAAADPTAIPTENFEREGFTYTLLDLLREGRTETETKPHTETVTKSSDTQDMAKILVQLDAALPFEGADGFSGTLTLNPKSITVAAAGYQNSSKSVTASRTYPGLSNADASLLPKTVQENGRTLELSDVAWATAPGSNEALPATYTATVTYSGTATSKYATGYTVTAAYTGELARTVSGAVIYTAVFAGTPVEPPVLAAPDWVYPLCAALSALLALAVITLLVRESKRRKELKKYEKVAEPCASDALPDDGADHPGVGVGV